jgi:hypothetical protein
MENTSNEAKALKKRETAYYRQRQKNHVFAALTAFFADEAMRGNITKKELANRLGRDPSQITRWLSAPSNFELDTLSDILLAMGAEMDHEIVRFSDRHEAEDVYQAKETATDCVLRELRACINEQVTSGVPKGASGTDKPPLYLIVSVNNVRR